MRFFARCGRMPAAVGRRRPPLPAVGVTLTKNAQAKKIPPPESGDGMHD
jgi:hypothetical protein